MDMTQTTQITVRAASMLVAQGVTLSAEQRATLVAKADRFRAITETTGKTCMSVPVLDIYTDARIGSLDYYL